MLTTTITHLLWVPKKWLIPKREQALLAIIALIFWGATLWQAVTVDAKGTSVFSLFGLGLLYLVFSIVNLTGAVTSAVSGFKQDADKETQARSLVQLFVIMAGMFVLNVAVLVVYVVKGTTMTPLDTTSLVIDFLLVLALTIFYGPKQSFKHPVARGWLAIAGKTVPQIVMAWLFFTHPNLSYGLALLTLLGINALSFLRFLPTFKAFRRDKKDIHLRGLMIGETGNFASGLLLTIAWLIPHIA